MLLPFPVRALPFLVCIAVALVALPAPAQTGEAPLSERAERGFKLLGEKGFKLAADIVTDEGKTPRREVMSSYTDLVLLVNKRKAVTFRLLGPEEGKERDVASIKATELPTRILGAWLWYKICSAADLLESCRTAGVIS